MRDWDARANEIFVAAMEIESAEEQQRFLDSECRGDQRLNEKVVALMEAAAKCGSFLEHRCVKTSAGTGSTLQVEETPKIIGPYKLLEVIGEGGMGTVYMAKQTQPVNRRVALKLIKAGMDTRQVVARFEAERQALARMEHPNIAKVLDAGSTDSGRPYFVMELVKGKSITQFCDDQKLDLESRLKLFQQVCHAVQHAHQKGIIHRDIKPSNVLVAMYDDRPVPKVIDFGVAKATGEELTEKTMFTRFGQIVGTLEYMSPEQAQFNQLDIDTRSDIYSLAAILCELLSGEPPFARDKIRNQPLDETLRMIREEEPTKPSTKLSGTARSSQIASDRKTSFEKLGSILRGDLDWIVMKALDKDRTRRYETANGLALDIGRYLDDEPVLATPPSAAYRFRKFASRNKVGIAFATAAVIGLLVFAIGLATSNVLIRQQKEIAEQKTTEAQRQKEIADRNTVEAQKQKEIADRKTAEAQTENRYARAIADFVKNDFLALTSAAGQARFDDYRKFVLNEKSTLRELLDRAAEKLDSRADLDPRIEAELRWIIGVNYSALNEGGEAIRFLQKSADLHGRVSGKNAEETIRAENILAAAYSQAGQHPQAVSVQKPTLERCRQHLGTNHPITINSIYNLGLFYNRAGHSDKSLLLWEQAAELQTAEFSVDDPQTVRTKQSMAWAYLRAGQTEKCRELLEQALASRTATLGADHLDTLNSMQYLGMLYVYDGQINRGLRLLRQPVRILTTNLGKDHPDTLQSIHNLAIWGYLNLRQYEQAIPLLKELLEAKKFKLGQDHPDTVAAMNTLAWAHECTGQLLNKGLPLFEQVMEIWKTKLGEDHPDTLLSMNRVGWAYHGTGQTRKAVQIFERILEIRKAKLGEDHPDTLFSMFNLGWAHHHSCQLDQSIPLLEQIVELSNEHLPDPRTGSRGDSKFVVSGWQHNSLFHLATAYNCIQQHDKAIPLFEQALAMRKARLGHDHPDTLACMRELGTACALAGHLDMALPLLEETVEIQTAKYGEHHPQTLLSQSHLGAAYFEAGMRDKALSLLQRTVEILTTKYYCTHVDAAGGNAFAIISQLAAVYRKAGQPEKAVPLLQQMIEMSGEDFLCKLYSRNTLASTYLQLKEWADAEDLLRQNLDMCDDFPFDSWAVYYATSMLGEALRGQQDYAAAETLLLDGYHGLVTHCQPNYSFRLIDRDGSTVIGIDTSDSKSRVEELIQRLVNLYEDWHLAEPDAGYDTKLAEWQQQLEEHEALIN